MIKILKSWGGSIGILLDSEDLKIYELKQGDLVDIEICKITKNMPYIKENKEMLKRIKREVKK